METGTDLELVLEIVELANHLVILLVQSLVFASQGPNFKLELHVKVADTFAGLQAVVTLFLLLQINLMSINLTREVEIYTLDKESSLAIISLFSLSSLSKWAIS